MAALIDRDTARRLHKAWHEAGDRVGWCVTTGTWDNPPHLFAAVPHIIRKVDKGAAPAAQAIYMAAVTLEEIREMLPPGLVRFSRAPEDDPVILETWF
jgi:hypothetical protein